jgi:ribosome-associated protein
MSAAANKSFEKARLIVEAALERNAQTPLVLDIGALTSFADAFVLLSGRSDRQVRAIADGIVSALREADDAPLGVEGIDEGRWVLIDCNDVIVHVFDPEMRDLYALERLWSDAPNVDLVGLGLDPAVLAEAQAEAQTGAQEEVAPSDRETV